MNIILAQGEWSVVKTPYRIMGTLYAVAHSCGSIEWVRLTGQANHYMYYSAQCVECFEPIPGDLLALRDFSNM